MPKLREWLLWVSGSTLALLNAFLVLPASHVGSSYLPVGNDSFYHARRILDAIPHLLDFPQFDPRVHFPDGSLIVWPWGYDFLLAALAKMALSLGLTQDPMQVLVFIPAFATLIAIALVIGIARRLNLSTAGTAMAVICTAISPLTQILYGVGAIDHHWAENLLWLASICAVFKWLDARPESMNRDAIIAGVIVGAAPAFHSDLFIIQLPLVAALVLCWLQGVSPTLRAAKYFALTLCCVTIAICAPSLAFHNGYFAFYVLSWFHVYAAFATAIVALFVAKASPGVKEKITGAGIIFALTLPGLTQVPLASSFVAGGLEALDKIAEVKSPLQMAIDAGAWSVSSYYSALIWLAPLIAAGCLIEVWKTRELAQRYFWFAAAMGLLLMLAQFRFHNFGSFALYLPLIIWIERTARKHAPQRRALMLGLGLTFAAAHIPITRQLLTPLPPASDFEYALTRKLYVSLASVCRSNPGAVLATNNDGHYIRFHTECSVLANNFITTAEDEAKFLEDAKLLSLSANEFAERDRSFRYVFVHLVNLFEKKRGGLSGAAVPLEQAAASNPRLVRELVLSDVNQLPARFELLDELRFEGPDGHPYARLFKVAVPSMMDSTASTNVRSITHNKVP